MVFESREIIGDWELIHYEFVPDDKEMKLDIAVEAGKAYVGDLMLCVGAGTTWNQANRIVEYDVNGVSVRRVISDGQVSSGKTSMIPIDQRNACMWIIRE